MPEFLTLLPPRQALQRLFQALPPAVIRPETIQIKSALGRVTAAAVIAPSDLPAFNRSAVDGYAVIASDTYGASESLPAYLALTPEILMGAQARQALEYGQAAPLSTGGMLPPGANAVVMLENTRFSRPGELELLRPAAEGENVILAGEDARQGDVVLPAGRCLRPEEIGGLAAFGIENIPAVRRPRVAILSSGDELVPPGVDPRPGQVRDINSYTLSALVQDCGAEAVCLGIAPDRLEIYEPAARDGLDQADVLIITAGSSASARDLTVEVISSLGEPGVLVHGLNVRPGKPTILAVCGGKPVVGLPGNPVSALVIARLCVVPLIEWMLGMPPARPRKAYHARLSVNIPSQAGREDWIPARIHQDGTNLTAQPVFFKSNLIFNLANADGLIYIPAEVTGFSAGELVEIY